MNLEIQRSQYINVRKLFKGGNYSRAETMYMRKYGNSTSFSRNVHAIRTAMMQTSVEGARQNGAKQIVDVHQVVNHVGNFVPEPAIPALKKF